MTSVLGSEEKFEILDSFLTEIYIFFREDKIQIFEYFEFSTTHKQEWQRREENDDRDEEEKNGPQSTTTISRGTTMARNGQKYYFTRWKYVSFLISVGVGIIKQGASSREQKGHHGKCIYSIKKK